MTALSPSPANKRRTLYRNLMIGLLGAFTVLALTGRMLDIHFHGLASVLLLATLVIAVLQFQSLDEVAKQAHYVAWLWGSMTVMGLVVVALAVLNTWPGSITIPIETPLISFFGDANPDTAFLMGFISSPILMAMGFGLWWAVYWLRRR